MLSRGVGLLPLAITKMFLAGKILRAAARVGPIMAADLYWDGGLEGGLASVLDGGLCVSLFVTYTWDQKCRVGCVRSLCGLSLYVVRVHRRFLLEQDQEGRVCITAESLVSNRCQRTQRHETYKRANPIVILHVPAMVNLLFTTQYKYHTAPFQIGLPTSTK